jgi:hypothetical protein
VKKFHGQDLLGMLPEEVAPADAGAPGSGADAVSTEDIANGEVRAVMTKLQQLALNAAITPARVLASQTQYQFLELGSQSGSTEAAPGGSVPRPPATNQLSMPPEQGLRADQECVPSWSVQSLAQGGEQHPVTRLPPGPPDQALEDAKLMPENQDL